MSNHCQVICVIEESVVCGTMSQEVTMKIPASSNQQFNSIFLHTCHDSAYFEGNRLGFLVSTTTAIVW